MAAEQARLRSPQTDLPPPHTVMVEDGSGNFVPTSSANTPTTIQGPIQQAPPAPKEKPIHIPGALPGIEGAIDKASQAQASAAMDEGKAKSDQALAEYAVHKDAAEKAQQAFDDYQKRAQANQAQIDKAMSDVATGKIDPQHFMNSRSTGQRITGAIGMILGGVGAGMTGGQNPVLGIINNQIERDIEAQKNNLESKRGLVKMYMEQGHDLRASSELAMNALKQIAGAKLDAAASQAGSPIAQAAAKQAAAKYIMDGKQGMMKAHGEALNQIKTGLEIAQARQQLAFAPTQRAIQMAALQGAVLPPSAQGFMDPETTVPVPGGVTMARGKESASAIRDMQTAHSDYEAALHEIEALKDKTSILPKGELSREGQLALDHYAAASKALQGKSGLARTSEEEQIQKQMGNPTDIFRTAGGTQKLIDAARKMGMRHRGAVFAAHLIGGRQAAAGLEAPNGR